jgi:hypothetical protein
MDCDSMMGIFALRCAFSEHDCTTSDINNNYSVLRIGYRIDPGNFEK